MAVRLSLAGAEAPSLPPKGLFAFLWHYTRPAAPWLALLGFCSMVLGIAEVVLFQFLGNIVDWLSAGDPSTFLAREGDTLVWMAVLLLVLILAGANFAGLNGGAVGVAAAGVAASKASLSPMAAFCRGIMCNVLVCLAVWMSLPILEIWS